MKWFSTIILNCLDFKLRQFLNLPLAQLDHVIALPLKHVPTGKQLAGASDAAHCGNAGNSALIEVPCFSSANCSACPTPRALLCIYKHSLPRSQPRRCAEWCHRESTCLAAEHGGLWIPPTRGLSKVQIELEIRQVASNSHVLSFVYYLTRQWDNWT